MLLALAFSITILASCVSMPLSLSGTGINYFALQFKVPLGILALGLALIGLCGANHRSEQTKPQIERTSRQIELTTQQIKLTTDQNNFSNYYKHIEEFDKYSNKLSKDRVTIKVIRLMHSKLYPKSCYGDFTTSVEAILTVDSACKEFIDQTIKCGNPARAATGCMTYRN